MELLKLRFGESHMHYCEVMLKVMSQKLLLLFNIQHHFGAALHEVFARKDMADSRRINTNIREEESKLGEEEQPPLSLSSLILSSEFWPPLKEEKLELPPLVVQAMEAYTHRYEKLKVSVFLLWWGGGASTVNAGEGFDENSVSSPVFQAMRTLSWKPHLGSVTLDVELEDRTLTNLTVSPFHAAIILHFQEKSMSSCSGNRNIYVIHQLDLT